MASPVASHSCTSCNYIHLFIFPGLHPGLLPFDTYGVIIFKFSNCRIFKSNDRSTRLIILLIFCYHSITIIGYIRFCPKALCTASSKHLIVLINPC